MKVKLPELSRNRKFIVVIFALAITLIMDTAFVKINDLVDKYIIPIQSKVILFFSNSIICLFLQLYIIKFIINSVGGDPLDKGDKVRTIYIISLTSFFVLAILVGLLVFQLFYNHYYETWISISIITVSYGTSAVLIIWLSLLFFDWYRSSHDLVVFLYFISMSLIAFHLIMTGLFIGIKLSDNQYLVGEYVGASGDASLSSHLFLGNIYRASTFISFFGIWMTTAILLNPYKEKLIRSVTYWIVLILPLVYFIITYFYQFFLSNLLTYYFQNDPLTVSVLISAFFSLSKPIGG
jgi:hypothetical protein